MNQKTINGFLAKKQKYPIIILLMWLTFTFLLFLFGPYEYKIDNKYEVCIYIIFINIFLYCGYLRGLKSNGRYMRIDIKPKKFVEELIIIVFFYILIKMIISKGGDFRNTKNTFIDASISYREGSSKNTGVFSYIDIVMIPIQFIAITNGIYNYKKYSRPYNIATVLIILYVIGSAVGSATRAGMVQVIVYIVAALGLAVKNGKIGTNKKFKSLLIVSCIVLLILFIVYSSILVSTRTGFSKINPLTKLPPIDGYIFYRNMPDALQLLFSSISFYISHSYYSLSLALEMPMKGIGFGLSNSYFIMNNITKITGSTFLQDISYGMRLDKYYGGSNGLYWSTFYTWIASDFSFYGVFVIIFLLGYYLALCLKDSLISDNPFAISVFCILFYFIIHFVFNNPMQDGAGIATNFIIPLIWLMTRKKDSMKLCDVKI